MAVAASWAAYQVPLFTQQRFAGPPPPTGSGSGQPLQGRGGEGVQNS